jgi:two-component system, NtrC family, response regulator HydG
MAAAIRGVFGPHEKGTFALEGDLTLGRDQANQVAIDDVSVSRRHCMIARDGSNYVIRDLGSHNGTFVNGSAVDERILENGDRIAIGASVFEFTAGTATPVSAAVVFDEVHSQSTIESAAMMSDEATAAMSLPRQRLSHDFAILLTVATKLRGVRDSESLLWQLVGVLLEVIPAERVVILLGEERGSLESAFAWDKITGPGQPVRVSRTIVERALTQERAILINDAPKLSRSTSVEELHVRAVLCAPIATPEKQLGAIYMDSRTLGSMFDAGHLHLLSAIAGMTALALENARVLELLARENEQLKSEVRVQFEMIGESTAMQEVYRFIAKVAPTESNVLIHGESGTGKELVARAIHRHSARADRPFVAINCAAITETLLESELFGHEKGAFTGAATQKKGYLEVADGGTVFLDEIGELALPLQAKLLRVVQERELVRVGGTKPIKVDIRILAATNRSLAQMAKEGKFREDLFYRLNVLACKIPSLRSRREDIPVLATHFAEKYAARCNRGIREIADDAMACLKRYDWPGNVRELENAIEHAVVLGSTREILRDDLPESLLETGTAAGEASGYHEQVTLRKKELILDALDRSNGNFMEAARLLDIHPNYLHRLVTVLELRAAVKKTSK